MPLDPYSLCPGGRDKKIKFCCNDLLKEIGQIERLLESNQSGACLSYIESVEKNHPDCACLTAAKLSAYRLENRWKEVMPLAESFHQREPSNPVASAEYALSLAVSGNPREAISILIDAFEAAKEGTAHSAVINAMLQVGATLLVYGQVLPVVAIGNQLKNFPSVQEQANALLYRASELTEIPLLLRDMMFEPVCPENYPGQEEFGEAVVFVGQMRWKSALAKLEGLTQYAGSWAAIWRNVASVRFWLLDTDGGLEALKQYVLLSNVALEDAVDAETTRLFLTPDALGDQTDILEIEYPVTDAEKAHERILSVPQFYQVGVQQRDPNVPPPKCGFVILNKPFPAADADLTLESVASQQASALLFGKETDREARLVVSSLLEDNRFEVEKQLGTILGDSAQSAGNVLSRRQISRSSVLVQYRFRFSPEAAPKREALEKLERDYYEQKFMDAWSRLPLGILDGKTPLEAAADPQYKIKVLAVIQYIESMMNEELGNIICNELREQLSLPVKGTIPVTGTTSDEALSLLDELPVWRWYRLETEKIPTDVLVQGLQIASVMKEPRATLRFSEEILNRPLDSVVFEIRLLAFENLIETAIANGDYDKALLWIDRGRNESAAKNIPDAAWCLNELRIRVILGQADEFQRLVTHLVTHYKNDARVMQALRELYISLGIINQDGTVNPAVAQQAQEQPAAAGGIWTPEQAAPANAGGTSKLWVPD
ncbi:protein disulfide-isomerase [Planctomycetales bacterium]|nr:protein disulfide-isomerase [Planctomycetales bacterium]